MPKTPSRPPQPSDPDEPTGTEPAAAGSVSAGSVPEAVPAVPRADEPPSASRTADTVPYAGVPTADTVPADGVPSAHPVPLAAQEAPARPPSRVRSGAVPFLLGAAAVVIVLVLAGGTSWVVARAVAAEPIAAPASTSAPRAANAPHGDRMRKAAAAVRGTIRSIDGATWTLATPKGGTARVTVGDETRFVREGAQVSAGDFRVGDAVVVVGTREDGSIEAHRIALPKPRPSASPTPDA